MRDAYENIEKIINFQLGGKNLEKSRHIELAQALTADLTFLRACTEDELLERINIRIHEGRRVEDVLRFLSSRLTLFENYDDSSYTDEYHLFKELNTLFDDEARFYKPVKYSFQEGYEFTYQPPSVSYTPLLNELYKLCGGELNFHAQDTDGRKQELYNKMREIFGKRRVLEIGAGPGFGLHGIRKVARSAVGIDKERFQEQPKTISIVQGDARAMDTVKALASKRFDLIYSLDVLEGELLLTTNDALRIVTNAHNLLAPGGLQAHAVLYKPYSRKVKMLSILTELANAYKARDIVKKQMEWPQLDKLRSAVHKEMENFPHLHSRTLVFNEGNIQTLSRELPAEIVKHEVSNGHWIVALKKSKLI